MDSWDNTYRFRCHPQMLKFLKNESIFDTFVQRWTTCLLDTLSRLSSGLIIPPACSLGTRHLALPSFVASCLLLGDQPLSWPLCLGWLTGLLAACLVGDAQHNTQGGLPHSVPMLPHSVVVLSLGDCFNLFFPSVFSLRSFCQGSIGSILPNICVHLSL